MVCVSEFLRLFKTVGCVSNFRTLGNMFVSFVYVTKSEMGLFIESASDILRYFTKILLKCLTV